MAAGVILDFIISECTEMAQLLPVSYTNFGKEQETGRVTKGVALALKARAALYAASPLFNPDNDKSKWIAAAEAAYEIIGTNLLWGILWIRILQICSEHRIIEVKSYLGTS